MLKSAKPYFKERATQNAQANINLEVIKPLAIAMLPFEEQKAIAAILSTWDVAIEKTEQLIELKRTCHKKLIHRLITCNSNRRNWKVFKIDDLIEERKEKSIENDQFHSLTSSRNGIVLQSEYFNKQVTSRDTTGYKVIRKGDFTYRSMSDDGLFVFNRLADIDVGIISPAYGVFFPKSVHGNFLYYLLNSDNFRSLLSREVQGGTRTALRLNALKNIKVQLPAFNEQKEISDFFVDHLWN